MIDPEIAFADLNDNMQLTEDLFEIRFQLCSGTHPVEMEFFDRFIMPGVKKPDLKLW